jgi:phenylalanyl-tRNA synthetase beta chain
MVLPALDRCAGLIAELAGGTVRPGVVDCVATPAVEGQVRLRWSRPRALLGMDVSREEARRVLLGLGFRELAADEAGATFAVPSWRVDVSIEEDLVEELVRTRGYDAIPETLPPTAVGTSAEPLETRVLARLREAIEAAGFSEAVNFSFVAEPDLAPLRYHVATGDGSRRALGIALQNPISADLALMRTSLVPSLLKNARHNRAQRVEDLRLYELARVYHPAAVDAPGDAPSTEDLRVAGVLLGRRAPLGWATPAASVDFHDAKAAVASVLEALGVPGVRWEVGAESWLHPRVAARVLAADGAPLGWVGELHPRVAAAFDVPRGVLAFELSIEALVRVAALVPQLRPIPTLPAVLRDLAVVVGEPVTAAAVLAAVREEPLVDHATLFDVYRGPPIPAGKKNLALSIRYRAADRTLTDVEADAAHRRIVDRLVAQVGAELRG